MHHSIELRTPLRPCTGALRIIFSGALICTLTSLLGSGAVAAPILGNYPDTLLPLSTDTMVTPDAAPTDTTSITVFTSTDFQGTSTGDRATGARGHSPLATLLAQSRWAILMVMADKIWRSPTEAQVPSLF